VITSTANPKIKLVRLLQTKRSRREAEQLFVVEGVRLLEEAVRANVVPRLVLHTDHLDPRGRSVLNQLARLGAESEPVSDDVMAVASDTQTPAGLLAVLPMRPAEPPEPLSFALVLDRVADPGNLGTLLRTALAAGVQAVFLGPGTVDAYNPKVVRAALGAHLHLPLLAGDWDKLGPRLSALKLWRAEAHTGTPYPQVDWRAPVGLVIGSEADGPSDTIQGLAPNTVHIPMPGPVESLNAAIAGGVLLFEAARQRQPLDAARQRTDDRRGRTTN
jgi:TrmH family RNA methyltransferase